MKYGTYGKMAEILRKAEAIRRAKGGSGMEYEIVLIDATESPVERPKKGSGIGIPERKNGTR